jgi:hypothetical protein
MDIGHLASEITFCRQLTDSMPDASIHRTSVISMIDPTPQAIGIPAMTSNAGIEVLIANPTFLGVLQQGARHMIELYDRFPRTARLVSAQQKWLLTQAAYALHLQRDPADPRSGITAARLLDSIVDFDAASRNTATAFLAELLAYKLIRDVPGATSKRSRPLEPTEASHEAMGLWFRGQMRSLDLLDQGNRVETLEANPKIFQLAQPIAASSLIADRAWREPPVSISCFVWTEYGGLILDDFVSRLVNLTPENGYHRVEGLRFSELSTHYSLSRTHVRRLFDRADALGSISIKDGSGTRKTILAAASFIRDYQHWQAIKFSALERAYRQAVHSLDIKTASADPA